MALVLRSQNLLCSSTALILSCEVPCVCGGGLQRPISVTPLASVVHAAHAAVAIDDFDAASVDVLVVSHAAVGYIKGMTPVHPILNTHDRRLTVLEHAQ